MYCNALLLQISAQKASTRPVCSIKLWQTQKGRKWNIKYLPSGYCSFKCWGALICHWFKNFCWRPPVLLPKISLKRSDVLGVRCYEGTSHVLLPEEAPLSFFYWLQIAEKTVFALPPSFLEAIRNTTTTFHMSISFSSVMFLWAREVCSHQC